MTNWSPCKRLAFIRKLKCLGFSAPEAGGRHLYMRRDRYTLALPGNAEYSVPPLKMLLREIAEGTDIKLTAREWAEL